MSDAGTCVSMVPRSHIQLRWRGINSPTVAIYSPEPHSDCRRSRSRVPKGRGDIFVILPLRHMVHLLMKEARPAGRHRREFQRQSQDQTLDRKRVITDQIAFSDTRNPQKENRKLVKYKLKVVSFGLSLLTATAALIGAAGPLQAQDKKPNILFIMGDDVGWFNIGAYHRGIMSGKTPNLDKLASQGMLFTDYYAEASCTAGRANFITGEIPLRTGLTTVGQAGADVGMPAQACTLATALKAQGYATGQFGKNHLGDLNKFLPTVHGFDEFFGYLYHLDAMSDPYWSRYPQDWIDKYGPRNLVHC